MLRNVFLLVLLTALSACRQVSQKQAAVASERAGSAFTGEDVQRMVEQLFIEKDPRRVNFEALSYAGAQAVPFLTKALDDPRTQKMTFAREGLRLEGYSPFERICSLLHDLRPVQAIKPLTRYLNHPNPTFRSQAAWVLAGIASAECLAPVKKALADPDSQVRGWALIGVQYGLRTEPRNQAFFDDLFPAILPLLEMDGYASSGHPAETLADIDFDKAVPILESPQHFSTRNPHLGDVLVALNRSSLKVPQPLLMPVLRELKKLAIERGEREWDCAAALTLYARNPDDEAESQFRMLLGAKSQAIASAAAEGLQILAGIAPDERSSSVYEARGLTAMTQPQKYYYTIEAYREEVDNGGHSQYFHNSTGDHYETVVEGLRAVGATAKSAILADALRAFGPDGASPDNKKRRGQMKSLELSHSEIFEAADRRFYDSEEAHPDERLDKLLTLYALNHRDDFTPLSKKAR